MYSQFNPNLSSPIDSMPTSPNADWEDMEMVLYTALKTDDLEAFETLFANNEIEIADFDFANNQNCLHAAILLGSNSIALFLADSYHESLINSEDAFGSTPLMYAAQVQADNPELVAALIKAGACDGLSKALTYAAVNGYRETAKLLIQKDGAAVSKTLVAIVDEDNDMLDWEERVQGARLLISLGVNASEALVYAVRNNWWTALNTLRLLGASGSDALVLAAMRKDTLVMNGLILDEAAVTTALISLVKNPNGEATREAAKLLMTEEASTAAFLRLAKSGHTAALQELIIVSAGTGQLDLGWKDLAKRGNVKAIEMLISSDPAHAEKILHDFVFEGHLAAARTLVTAGVNALPLLENLLEKYKKGHQDSRKAIELLIVIKADLLARKNQEITEEINKIAAEIKRKIDLSRFTERDRNAALLRAVNDENVAEVALLLAHHADPVVALRRLSRAANWDGIHTLIKAGMVASEALIDCVEAGAMNSAHHLFVADDVSTLALIDLVENGELETARAFIPASTDGAEALAEAVKSNNKDLAKKLLDIEADGPEALRLLLKNDHYEAAGRLIAFGVDIHTTLMLAIREDYITYNNDTYSAPAAKIMENLGRIGAEFPMALLRASERADSITAVRINREITEEGRVEVVMRLLKDQTRTTAVKARTLTWLLKENLINPKRLVESVKEKIQRNRIRAGEVLTTERFTGLGRTNSRNTAKQRFRLLGDFAFSMNHLIANRKYHTAHGGDDAALREKNAANGLSVALADLASGKELNNSKKGPTNPSTYA